MVQNLLNTISDYNYATQKRAGILMHGYGKETLRLGTEIVGHSSSNSARTAEKTEILIHFRLRTILSKKYVNARHEK